MEIRQRKFVEKQETEPFNVSAYAETVGPQALRFLVDRQSTSIRKVIWAITTVFGLLYSAHNIKLCTLRYLSYPSTIKPTQDLATPVRFPKITICNNNMHSLSKVRARYPWIEEALPALYAHPVRYSNGTSMKPSTIDDKLLNDTRFANLNMTQFLRRTVPETQIVYCIYHKQDCRNLWKYKLTMNGFCLVFNNDTQVQPTPKIAVGRQTSLTLMVLFNDTDVSAGWWYNFEGFTVFYTEPSEDTIDPVYSVALHSERVPIVSVAQEKTALLGYPYQSECLKSGHQLEYFERYTDRHCYQECSFERIAKKCGCRAVFFPKQMGKKYPVCNFVQQARCIAPMVQDFDYDACKVERNVSYKRTGPSQAWVYENTTGEKRRNCLPECTVTRHLTDSFHNTIYRDANMFSDETGMKMATMVLYMSNTVEVCYTETPEYTHDKFLSDVGGTAGLILGMSAATLFGLIDVVLSEAAFRLRKLVRAFRDSITSHNVPRSDNEHRELLKV